jgi:cytochrome c-type biogenesis protein CcmH/NrfG
MTRTPPPSDWVVYLVVLGTVAAMMYGKYLMGRGDKPMDEVASEDIQKIEDEVEHIVEEVEKKL